MIDPVRGIYPILDVGPLATPAAAPELLAALIAGGARWIQLRAKHLEAGPLLELARALGVRCRAADVRLIVNDRPDVAVLAGAGGVHLGQDDLPAAEVRRWLPEGMIIGVSCHDLDQIASAKKRGGADYLAYGPIFATSSKARPDPVVGLDGLALACRAAGEHPVVAIGGITVARLPEVRRAGAAAAAMISELIGAPDVKKRTQAAISAFAGEAT